MNARPTWTTGSTEVFKTGTWRAALPRHIEAPSPCHHACPVQGEIAHWIGLARAGDLRGAWRVLAEHNPFPAIAGRICHHPCESACNRATLDEPISIRLLERHVGDHAIAEGWAFDPPRGERSGRVAVVGGGPAGLSAGYQLRRRGWRVTLLEASSELVGVMRHSIPAYRLPRTVLDAEIARIVALGVEVRCGIRLDDLGEWARLRATHDALFVAVGAARPKRLPSLDYTAPWVMDGAAYLAAMHSGTPPALGRTLAVIGGGSAALDAARSARRAGHEVTVLALESRAQMPAQHEEVDEALEEGVVLLDGAMLVRAEPLAAGVRLHCCRVRFEAGGAPGRFSVEPIAGSEFELVADAVLSSIGQDPDLAPFGPPLAGDGGLIAVDRAGATVVDGVWAGGDVASTARFVTEAVGMGERAALAIHRRLLGRVGDPGDLDETENAATEEGPAVGADAIATWYHAGAARAVVPRRSPAERQVAAGAEVQPGFDAAQALAEAARCFSCGRCIACDNCVIVCPDLAVRRVEPDGAADGGAGMRVRYEVLADYCKGCGLCVRECPTGSMEMLEERR